MTQEQSAEYAKRYRANENPEIERFYVRRADGHRTRVTNRFDLEPPGIAASERVTFEVSWADCPTEALCGDGICSSEAGRPDAEGDKTFTENAWTAPDNAGDVQLWVVIRDDRGGVGFEQFTVSVRQSHRGWRPGMRGSAARRAPTFRGDQSAVKRARRPAVRDVPRAARLTGLVR